jgi:hypothetical protein
MKRRDVDSLAGIFAKPPEIMADLLASKSLFSGGPVTGLRVLSVYIAYAGKRLSVAQRHSLERARELLAHRIQGLPAGQETAEF